MSNNNTFNGKRFLLLFRQHFIHNNRLFLYSVVAYVGVIFLLLSLVQMAQDRRPHDLQSFTGFFIGFVAVFGILYVGYSFPAFRSKEKTINYLMLPGSVFEKFLSELVIRIGLMLILLPFLFWVTFNIQGYFFNLFSDSVFQPVGIQRITEIDIPGEVKDVAFWFVTFIVSLVFLALILPFTGAAMFSKQPLIKTLFSVALIVIFYSFVIYITVEFLRVGKYNPNGSLWLFPNTSEAAFRFFGCAALLTDVVMLFVAYRKLKEKEV